MDGLIFQISAGISTGAIYGSLALAMVMIYRATGHLNFAQGEMASLAAFGFAAATKSGLSFLQSLIVVVPLSALFGVAVYILLVKRIDRNDTMRSIVCLLGLYLIVNSFDGLIWGHDPLFVDSPAQQWMALSAIGLSAHEVLTIAVVSGIALILQAFFLMTDWGLAMRASAEQPGESVYVGIPVRNMVIVGWGIAAALGAIAGILTAPKTLLEPNMMLGVLIYGFASALLGGISNPIGAVAAGIIVGITENVVGAYFVGTEFKLVTTFFLIVALLIIRPNGLFSGDRRSRV